MKKINEFTNMGDSILSNKLYNVEVMETEEKHLS
jgi:hypothetical protein